MDENVGEIFGDDWNAFEMWTILLKHFDSVSSSKKIELTKENSIFVNCSERNNEAKMSPINETRDGPERTTSSMTQQKGKMVIEDERMECFTLDCQTSGECSTSYDQTSEECFTLSCRASEVQSTLSLNI